MSPAKKNPEPGRELVSRERRLLADMPEPGTENLSIFERTGAHPEVIVRELLRIGVSDPAECFGPDGAFLALQDMPATIRRAISSLKFDKDTGRLVGIKFWDKPRALEALARMQGLMAPREAKALEGIYQLLQDARDRADRMAGRSEQAQAAQLPAHVVAGPPLPAPRRSRRPPAPRNSPGTPGPEAEKGAPPSPPTDGAL